MLGKLNGCRDASSPWVAFISEVLTDMGFDRHQGCPHLLQQLGWDVTVELHQDDVHGCGSDLGCRTFLDTIKKSVACNVRACWRTGTMTNT